MVRTPTSPHFEVYGLLVSEIIKLIIKVHTVYFKMIWCGPIMVLERIANPSIGESRFLSSSLSRTANYMPR